MNSVNKQNYSYAIPHTQQHQTIPSEAICQIAGLELVKANHYFVSGNLYSKAKTSEVTIDADVYLKNQLHPLVTQRLAWRTESELLIIAKTMQGLFKKPVQPYG
ncbi:MAG TPA: hypothetical protein VK166_04990 [Chitinophagaceae bacterium]|nr:hypothetical protein [Chitinophagaceae bacterium]